MAHKVDEITMSHAELKKITNHFSRKSPSFCGFGAQGLVFKTTHNETDIAIKVFEADRMDFDEEQFDKEFKIHKTLQHENIVPVYGICRELLDGPGDDYKRRFRAIFMQYIPNKDLGHHLYDEFTGLDWRTRYKIIKGICMGLKFLHVREHPIRHLDLKPANILLDNNMTPKIADFGLSRIYKDQDTHITQSFKGTPDYMPPEFLGGRVREISIKFDIFSLGAIMIKIISGLEGPLTKEIMSHKEGYIEMVLEKWRKRPLNGTDNELDLHIKQIKRCIQLAIQCLDNNRHKRPDIEDVVRLLDEKTAWPWGAFQKIPPLHRNASNMDDVYKMTLMAVESSIQLLYHGNIMDPSSFHNIYSGIYTQINKREKEISDVVETTMALEVERLFRSLDATPAHGEMFFQELLKRWNLHKQSTDRTAGFTMRLYEDKGNYVEEMGLWLWRVNMIRFENIRDRLMEALQMDDTLLPGDLRAHVVEMLQDAFRSQKEMLKEICVDLPSMLDM